MSEIFSAVRLKERIIIITLLTVLALVVGGSAVAVTLATTTVHKHNYEFHLDKTAEGSFEFVGVCTFERCEDPYYVRYIESGVYEYVKTPATCCEEGVREYSFTFRERPEDLPVTYVYQEAIEVIPHSYVGEVSVKNGVASVVASCTNEGCLTPDLAVNNSADIKLDKTIKPTCLEPEKKIYTLTYNKSLVSVTVLGDQLAEHRLNGEYISTYLLSEGVYKYGTEGIIAVGSSDVGCGQSVLGVYQCEDCKQPQTVRIGKPDHVFAYSEPDTVKPTLEAAGSATIRCTNEGCDEHFGIEIPMAVDGENTTIVGYDHILESRYIEYTFVSEEYNFTVTSQFTLPWYDHTLAYVEADTVLPGENADGKAYVRCTYEGCDKHQEIPLPKVIYDTNDAGVNSVIIKKATEAKLAVAKYSFVSEEFEFTVEFETEVGTVLSHNYNYVLDFINGEITIVGKCKQEDCSEPVIYDTETPITTETFEATCMQPAHVKYSCVKDGKTYENNMILGFELGEHNFVISEGDTLAPTLDATGMAVLKCATDGCKESIQVTIPKMEIGVNATSEINDETGIETISYTYTDEEYGFTVTAVLERVAPHDHSYTYVLEPYVDSFDLIGHCDHPSCEEKQVIDNVPAVMLGDDSTCTVPGKQTWGYEYEGETYTCYLYVSTPLGHKMTYDIEAESTVRPTLTEEGFIYIYCGQCGELEEGFVLPKAVIGQNTTFLAEGLYMYMHVIDVDGHLITVAIHVSISDV